MSRRRIPSVDEARAYVARFNFFERYVLGPEEGAVYVATHARRFVETLRRLPELPPRPRVLELGAVPYSMTILLHRYVDADVAPLSFYEVERGATHHVLESDDGTERFEFQYDPVNVERDVYPFADATFDLVLCGEILEHLLINPSHMLFECHRVLRPGGHILVSTPNVTRAENVRALSEGRNINDAYHGNGIYGRHNREFAPAEVALLLEACGYTVVSNETVDVYDTTQPGSAAGRQDTIFTLARTSGPRRMATPPSLYVLMDEYVNVIRSAVTMGVDELGHLGRGWYQVEFEGDMGFRWTRKSAQLLLKLHEAASLHVRLQSHDPRVLQRPAALTVSANGRPLGRRELVDHAWHEVAFDLPPNVSGEVRFEFAVEEDWSPGADDPRRLGVRVHRCWTV